MRFRHFLLLPLFAVVGSCNVADSTQPSVPASETFAASLGVDISTMTMLHPDLYYKDVVVGTGAPDAARNKVITVFYTGYLKDGTKFDSNVGGDSLRLPLTDVGQFAVISGWVLGIPGMKPGGTRKLVIGSAFAYGARQKGTIPPHSTLVFDIVLKRVE